MLNALEKFKNMYVYDGVFNSNPMAMSKLYWVLEGACLLIKVGQ